MSCKQPLPVAVTGQSTTLFKAWEYPSGSREMAVNHLAKARRKFESCLPSFEHLVWVWHSATDGVDRPKVNVGQNHARSHYPPQSSTD